MLKRTLFFSNPYRLSVKDKQLVVETLHATSVPTASATSVQLKPKKC